MSAGTEELSAAGARPSPRRQVAGAGVLVLLGAALVAVAFLGTGIYNYFIPNIAGAHDFSLGLATVAVVGGMAALLSPCAFGMLPAYFAYFLAVRGDAAEGPTQAGTVRASLRYGAATGTGIVVAGGGLAVLVVVLGAAFAPGLRVVTSDPNELTRGIRMTAAIVLILVGIAHLRGYRLPWSAASRVSPLLRERRARPTLWFFGYGLMYILVALPCVANLLAAPLLYAVATAGPGAAAGTALLFFSTMAVGSAIVAVLVGCSKDHVLRRFQASAPTVHRVAAIVFIVVGTSMLMFSLDLHLFRSLFFGFPISE